MLRRLGWPCVLVFLGLLAAQEADGTPALWGELRAGRHAVGYRVLGDSSLTVHVWYPAKGGGEPLTYGAYLGAEQPRARDFLAQAGIGSATIEQLMESRLHGFASALHEGRVAPLILVAHGNGQNAIDQAVLCEFLASHGYVVAATPSPMLRTPLEREDQVGELAELQATELARAASRVAAVLSVDTTRIGVIGHSFGARAALLLAMRDSSIRAVVSLDGGIGTATAQEAFRLAPSFREDARLPPVLHFYETLDPFMKPDFTLLERLDTRGLTLEPTRGMHHTHFTTYGFAAALFPDIARVTQATGETDRGVVAMAKKTRAFLDRELR